MTMKRLPPATFAALRPWPLAVPYTFFENWQEHRPNLGSAGFDPPTAWWLAEAAFLAYAPPDAVSQAFERAGIQAVVTPFSGPSTQCYLFSTADWHVLAFRGTQVDAFWPSVLDWATDFHIEPALDGSDDVVHAGFHHALDQVWKEDNIKQLRTALAEAPSRRLWITGHSLGAALATLAASRCQGEADILPHVAACYTYGSPRVGDPSFGTRIRVPVYRVRNNSDVVTDVPPQGVLKHVGEVEFLDNNGHLHVAWVERIDILHRVLDLNRRLIRDMRAGIASRDFIVPGPIADHAPINYSILLSNALAG
jgi:hypothetical protein